MNAKEEYLNDYNKRNSIKEKYVEGTSPSADKLVKELNLIKNASIYEDKVIKEKMLNLISSYSSILTDSTLEKIRYTFGLNDLTKLSVEKEKIVETTKVEKKQKKIDNTNLEDYKCSKKPEYMFLNLYELYAKKESLNLIKRIGYISLPIMILFDIMFFSEYYYYYYGYINGSFSGIWIILIAILEFKTTDYLKCIENRIETLTMSNNKKEENYEN